MRTLSHVLNTPVQIAFIGASTANLYGARIAKRKGYEVRIYEASKSLRNHTIRKLPEQLLMRCSYPREPYVRLTDLKEHLARHLDIVYDTMCTIIDGQLYANGVRVPTQAIVVNTGHATFAIEGAYTYSYQTTHREPGASLNDAFDRVERIIEKAEKQF